eukprot:Skav220491  [mRNA]  locus=scaffold591:210724:212948:+ [translate_table: standard]
MRASKQMWRLPDHEEKAKVEQDLPTDERRQKHSANLGRQSPDSVLQADRNSLQIWGDKAQTPCPRLAQICYLLDHRFARRYVCVIFVAEELYEATLAQWHEAFSSRMRTTLMLVQALQRAVGDKTTVARHSWNKAFDLANIPDPQLHFEYPLIPLSMSSSLAALLEKHPSLPLQGASGLLATVTQVFQDYGVQVEDYGKGSAKGALRDKGSDSPKKGKSKGVKPWSNWQDRAPDQSRWQWSKDDDNQDGPSGSSWHSSSKPTRTWTNWSARPAGKGRSTAKGSSRGGRSWDLVLCQLCLCALGVNLDCRECSKFEAPPGSVKQSAPVKTVWCPGIAADGSVCNTRLGFGDCGLCQAHVAYWKAPQREYLTVPPLRLAELYQLDRILYDYNVTHYAPAQLQNYIEELRTHMSADPAEFTAKEWANAWILRVLTREHHFLPLLQTSAQPFELDLKQTEEYLHNAGCIVTSVIRDHFATMDFFVYLFDELWQQDWEAFTSPWDLQGDLPDVGLNTAAVIPWDALVASSLQLAFEELERGELLLRQPGVKINRELFELLGTSLEADDFPPFESVLHRLADWLMQSSSTLDIFLGRDLYTNETLKTLSAFATGFTDVCFWQISRAYMVHTAKRPKAQHQVPNEALNFLYDQLVPLLGLPREDAQWALSHRHYNNKGNSLEVLLFIYAEEGSHANFWQVLWVLFMYQYKDSRFPWIVQVL